MNASFHKSIEVVRMKSKPIYVEIPIQTDMDSLWNATQKPELHEQWDLRFSSITYIPKEEGQPQFFTYTRTVGPFFQVEGWGKSIGSMQINDGNRSSSLQFGTEQLLSPIKEGRGYWQYKQQEHNIKFLTQYDYDVNFGSVGKVFDKIIFRPAIGWATALSFDVLKRWLERGELPLSQYIRFFSTYFCTLLFAFIWIYQGLVPKVINIHPTEQTMVSRTFSFAESQLPTIVVIIGIAEVLFGLVWLFYRHKRHLFILQLVVFPLLTIAAIVAVPESSIHPFNPVTFNLSLIGLSLLGLVLSKDVPTARNCKRQR